MTEALDILWRLARYFRLAGTASVLAWLAATAVLAVFAFRLRRLSFCFIAAGLCGLALLMAYILAGPLTLAIWAGLLCAAAIVWRRVSRTALCAGTIALALAGVLLGEVNSRAVSEIRIDRTAELLAARRRQERLRADEVARLQAGTADIQFVEDTDQDRLDLAGKTATQAALLTASRPADGVPEYRRRGKQTRSAPKPTGTAADFAELADGVARREVRPGRAMRAPDVIRANRLDRVNLVAVRLGLLVAILMLATDYLDRFNRTTGAWLALPVAGRIIDALFPKTRTAWVRSAAAAALRGHLETVVRKGETFVYFGPADPWRDVPPAPPRFDLPARLRRRPPPDGDPPLHRLPLGLWPVGKIVRRPDGAFPDSGFIFESAWFGRYCFVIEGAEAAGEVLAHFRDRLERRRRSRAAARKTVHLVWHLPERPCPDGLEELAWLCRETNFKLLVWSADGPPDETADAFEEHIEARLPSS